MACVFWLWVQLRGVYVKCSQPIKHLAPCLSQLPKQPLVSTCPWFTVHRLQAWPSYFHHAIPAPRPAAELPREALRCGPVVSSSSSASAGSGENRLDRRGEADPVLVMPEGTSDEFPVLWLRVTTEDCFLREGGVGGLEGAESRRREGGWDGWCLSFSSMSFRETCTSPC